MSWNSKITLALMPLRTPLRRFAIHFVRPWLQYLLIVRLNQCQPQHCTSKRLRRFALLEPELTLDKLLSKGRAFEISDSQASGIENARVSSPENSADINFTHSSDSDSEAYLFTVTNTERKTPKTRLKLYNIEVEFVIDTGASIDIIDAPTFTKLQNSVNIKLQRAKTRIYAYEIGNCFGADRQFQHYQRNNYPANGQKPKFIIVGDSMTKKIRRKEINDEARDYHVLVKSFPGATVEKMKYYLEPEIMSNPEGVIIHCGTNNLRNESPESVANKIVELAIEAKKRTQHVAVSSLVMRTDSNELDLKRARDSIDSNPISVKSPLGLVNRQVPLESRGSPLFESVQEFSTNVSLESGVCNDIENNLNSTELLGQHSGEFSTSDTFPSPSLTASSQSDISDFPDDLQNLFGLRAQYHNHPIIGFLNINSIRYKITDLRIIIEKFLPDILVIQETKLSSEFNNNAFLINNYKTPMRQDRDEFGGGLMQYVRKGVVCNRVPSFEVSSLELICSELTVNKKKWIIYSIYRPPERSNLDSFFSALSLSLNSALDKYDNVILMGDININTFDKADAAYQKLASFCDVFGLSNLVTAKTCFTKNSSSSIDVILTNREKSFQKTSIFETGLSDYHGLVLTILKSHIPRLKPKIIKYRNYKKFDPAKFLADVRRTNFVALEDPDKCYDNLTNSFRNLVDKHAPLKTKTEATQQDPTLQSLAEIIRSNKWNDISKIENANVNKEELKLFSKLRSELTVNETSTIILRDTRIVMPASLRKAPIEIAHEGHQGLVKTKKLLRTKIWLPRIDQMVQEIIERCIPCQATGPDVRPEPLSMSELPPSPWHTVHIDFCGPFPTGEYALVVIDAFSRFPEVDIVSSTSAKATLPKLERIFATHGLPTIIKSDNGPPLSGNGEVERFMKPLQKAIHTAVLEKKDWKRSIYKFLLNYRSTPHSTTGKTPAELLFNRNIQNKLPDIPTNNADHHNDLKETDSKAKSNMKDYADRKFRAVSSELSIGDTVLKIPENNQYFMDYDYNDDGNWDLDYEGNDGNIQRQEEEHIPQRYPLRERRPVDRYGNNIFQT
eukprot:gene3941-4486_t